MNYKVNEIFNSVEGEGKRAGELATFIRFTGCNLCCSYCDTVYAFAEGQEMTDDEIVKQATYPKVTITGGEPLLNDLHPLLEKLKDKQINIETNGSLDITEYFDCPHVFFTVDYKCPSSGENGEMLMSNFFNLRADDVLKFVVGDYEDLVTAVEICERYNPSCHIYVSPVFGKIQPAEIVDFLKERKLWDWRVQLQLHKFIWEPTRKGV